MGVYIKGMEMPTNCTECELRLIVGCNPYKDNGLSPSKERHKDCPLIEIESPHGTIIDIDELMYIFNHDSSGKTCGEAIKEVTVIEAEE